MLIYHYTSFDTFRDVNDIKETRCNAVVNTLAYPRECDDYDLFHRIDMSWMRYDIIYLLTQNSIKLDYSRKEIKELEHWELLSRSGNQRNNDLIDGKSSRNFRYCDRSIPKHEYFRKLIPRFDEIFKKEI